MASIGGVGVVLGLATQDLLQNLTAAVSLVRCSPLPCCVLGLLWGACCVVCGWAHCLSAHHRM